ncbi:MAG: KH domain-containing protein [bacterium]|nr:KH domain-containing protein [bacterium]
MAKKDIKKQSLSVIKIIEEIAAETLSLLGVSGKTVVAQDKENETLTVQIETDAAGILIGRHGETIDALQTFLNQAVFNKCGDWHRVIVNIGDYRERREESLQSLAEATAAKVKETGLEQPIFDLKPNERRIVHTILSEDPALTTESEGEGRDRHIVVKLKE